MQETSRQTAQRIILGGLIFALIVAVIVLSGVPPVSRDALTHHLAVPKLYLKHGGMYEIPSMLFSYYPMNLDLLYMLPLYFGNDIIPKFIHFAFGLLTAGLIFGYLKRRLDTLCALGGVLFFLSIPVIVKLSITVYVDLGLVFFSTATLLYFLKWIENAFKLKYLIISAVWCGFALGTKYNGLILLFLLTLFVPFVYSKIKHSPTATNQASENTKVSIYAFKAIGPAAAFLLIALILFSPWMVRNYIWTTNPVYPLYDRWIRDDSVDHGIHIGADSFQQKNTVGLPARGIVNPFAIRKIIYKETGWQIVTVPIRIFFQGQDDKPKYFDGKLNPYLFFLPLFAFFLMGKDDAAVKREKKILLIFSVLFLLLAFFQRDLRIRYIAPIIPPLVILCMYGLNNLLAAVRKKWHPKGAKIGTGIILAGVSLLLCLNAVYIWKQFKHVQPISYISGRLGRDAYIEKYRPEYAAIQYANQHLASEAKLFCLFLGNRSYYSDRQMFFGDSYFEKIVTDAESAETMLKEFKLRDITHLLIQHDIFNRWSRHLFNDREKKKIVTFFNAHTHLIFKKGGYGLYQL
jgi:hypothetical protein